MTVKVDMGRIRQSTRGGWREKRKGETEVILIQLKTYFKDEI